MKEKIYSKDIDQEEKKAIVLLLDSILKKSKLKGLKKNKGKILTIVEIPKRLQTERISKKISIASEDFTNKIIKILEQELKKWRR